MSGRSHAIFASAFLLLLGWWWFFERGTGLTETSAAGTVAVDVITTPETAVVDEAESQRQFAAMAQDQQANATVMSDRAADQEKRARAGARTVEFRKDLQISRDGDWLKFLTPHWSAYKTLRAKAAADPHGTTPCIICDGRGSMDSCFMCNSSGKCPTCKGTGKLEDGELCPTCLGSGKCYLCKGTGKMVCPFCDDGIIYKNAPITPNQLPINY